jgi:hypothetical protein
MVLGRELKSMKLIVELTCKTMTVRNGYNNLWITELRSLW